LLLQPRPSRLAAPPGWLALPVLHRHLCIRPIMCQYDVIHKPEVYNISHEDRATDIGNMRENLVKIARVVPEIRSRTDRQTDTVITILRVPFRGRSKTTDRHIGVNLAEILRGPESEHLGQGCTPAHSQRSCWGGQGRTVDWARSQSDSVYDSLELCMKTVGYEKAEFSEICKWHLRHQ